MAEWYLIVATKEGEHRIKIGKDESEALKALDDAKKHIGGIGTRTIADRVALDGRRIVSVRIEEDASGPVLA